MLPYARSYLQPIAIGRTLAATACIAGTIACAQTLDRHALVPDLETRFARANIGPDGALDGIVVLGGGSARMIEAVRLAKRYPKARLLISGHGEQSWHDYALKEGISPDRLLTEPHSRNTYENAVFSSLLVRPRPNERWLLVTSAAHMPRAMGVFRKAGFAPLAWPVHHLPSRKDALRHEWLGLVAYRLLGRSDSLVPSPQETRTLVTAARDLRIAGW